LVSPVIYMATRRRQDGNVTAAVETLHFGDHVFLSEGEGAGGIVTVRSSGQLGVSVDEAAQVRNACSCSASPRAATAHATYTAHKARLCSTCWRAAIDTPSCHAAPVVHTYAHAAALLFAQAPFSHESVFVVRQQCNYVVAKQIKVHQAPEKIPSTMDADARQSTPRGHGRTLGRPCSTLGRPCSAATARAAFLASDRLLGQRVRPISRTLSCHRWTSLPSH